MANLCEEPLEELLPAIFETWSHTNLSPKVHISSPRWEKFRAHAEYIDLEFIKPFLHIAKKQS